MLHEDSRDLTAFAYHKYILRYTRLIFDIAFVAEIHQRKIERVLRVRDISNDIIISAKSSNKMPHEIEVTLQQLREFGISISKNEV